MERPMQYEYSNEPEDDEDAEDKDGDTEAADRSYANELILQRSRNRHPAFTDDTGSRTTSTRQTSSMQAIYHSTPT